jgi:hypothetical protein
LQEAGTFAKHMKDPEFVKLFEEYAREISKPEVIVAPIQQDMARLNCIERSLVRALACYAAWPRR